MPTLPKIFRPVTRNTLIVLFGLTNTMHPDQIAPIGYRSTKSDKEHTTIVVNGWKRVKIAFKNISFISQQSDILMGESFQDFLS